MASSPVPPIEIGSLTASSPQESQFIGSSSGVFFVNTVHRAFARSKHSGIARDEPTNNIAFLGAETDSQNGDEESAPISPSGETGRSYYGGAGLGLGVPPSRSTAKELLVVYFQTWHPLFPFLHGPTFLRYLEAFYAGEDYPPVKADREKTCRATIFQCVFNIAALDRPDLPFPPECRIVSATALLSVCGKIASRHDRLSLQALLAAQLYLKATMSLRAADTVGGILARLLFHGGFHRCPYRYAALSPDDCEMRKRIFWSVYSTDRCLSQALGHPLGIQDSDIDVCFPGAEELHRGVTQLGNTEANGNGEGVIQAHLPQRHPGVRASTERDQHHQNREDIQASYASYCRLVGQALELFHKSIHSRSVDNRAILNLTSDVHAWWNGLPEHLQELPSQSTVDSGGGMNFATFFNIIYQHLILIINRPFLSLNPITPEFRLSLQTCVNVGRRMILTLKDHPTAFVLPGLMSGIWMAGLVLAFACEQELYPFAKGAAEIEICISLMQKMSARYTPRRHCHSAISTLRIMLNDLQEQFDNSTHANTKEQQWSASPRLPAATSHSEGGRKRQKLNNLPTSSVSKSVMPQPVASTPESAEIPPTGFNSANEPYSWATDPLFFPDTNDVFGQISWEALFQDDGFGTVPSVTGEGSEWMSWDFSTVVE